MTFLAPALLAGALLAAAPLIVHLLNRSRYRRVPWAAMEFLVEVKARAARRLRVEEMLLLALRTLAVLLVALAAARPFLSAAGPDASAEALILIDASASMQYREAAGTVFDFAKARARDVISGLPPGSRVLVGTFDAQVRFPSGREPTADLKSAAASIDALRPGWAGTDYRAALAAAAEMSRERFASRAPAVFIVSDFRRTAVGAVPAERPPGPLYLVPAADGDGEDVGIAGLVPAGGAFTSAAGQVSVTLSNPTSG